MNVVYYSSDFFSEMCGVAIESLCESNTDADEITVYVVEGSIAGWSLFGCQNRKKYTLG